MMRKRVCDVAAAYLRETDNPAVMWGDSGLLDEIFKRAGLRATQGPYTIEGHPLARWKRVLDALTKCPGELVPCLVQLGRVGASRGGRVARCFYLPEHLPDWLRKERER